MAVDKQTRKEIEFDEVCQLLATFCKSAKAKENALNLSVFPSVEQVEQEFNVLLEIKTIYEDDGLSMPHSKVEDIDRALKLLRIENGVLTLEELLKVYDLCLGTKYLMEFSVRYKAIFPYIYAACEHITSINEVLLIIKSVLNEKQQIKDDATPTLANIRQRQKINERELNKNFERALQKYRKDEIIGDIEETFFENKRLLSVLSQHKRRVNGKVRGTSARGTYTYIEPEANILLNQSQEQLAIDERNELYIILSAVTDQLRDKTHHLKAYQRLLVRFDLFQAKVIFAKTYNGCKPAIASSKKMYWENAIHPLLLKKNKETNRETVGQTIELEENKRFLVISGPNAGGKSITLKTVGLLQIMFQSGLFIPVGESSYCCWFDTIYTDIGDNQSIDNQLSTYSYRLFRMNFFLENVNKNTLLLLDEFGSGSDPELGGALAEVFFEELYQKKCFAVITTHYTNIKIVTASLPEALNACMLFDTKNLKPLYQLSIGQPGSSFTFEVAKLNGISAVFIRKAKEKVSTQKLKVDELTVSLQKEKSHFEKVNADHQVSNLKAKKAIDAFESKLDRLNEKAIQQAQFFEQQNKYVNTGKKIYDFIKKYKKHKTNKMLNEAVVKYVAMEKAKVLASEKPIVFNTKLSLPSLPVDTKKQENKVKEKEVEEKPIATYKVGDKVKLEGYKEVGLIRKIKQDTATVLIGNFELQIKTAELELVKKER